jgi:hypothetical protein
MFATLALILILSLATFDAGFYGVTTSWAAEKIVVEPVEREWGFQAEWRDYGSPASPLSLLTVVAVTPGGAFERSGIRVGYVFAPRTCGFGGPQFGGVHGDFLGRNRVRVRMLPQAREPWSEQFYEIVRRAA